MLPVLQKLWCAGRPTAMSRHPRRPAHAARIATEAASGASPYTPRHSFCLLLHHEGQSVIYLAHQMGHHPKLTLSTYGHVIEELENAPRIPAEDGSGPHADPRMSLVCHGSPVMFGYWTRRIRVPPGLQVFGTKPSSGLEPATLPCDERFSVRALHRYRRSSLATLRRSPQRPGRSDNRHRSPDARATGRDTAARIDSSVPTRISSRRARVTAV
jgi:hypothetical protein